MTPLIEKYFDTEKIKSIAEQKQFDEETYQEFIRFLDYNLEQDDRLGFDEEDHEKSSFDYALEYIDEIVKEKTKGFINKIVVLEKTEEDLGNKLKSWLL